MADAAGRELVAKGAQLFDRAHAFDDRCRTWPLSLSYLHYDISDVKTSPLALLLGFPEGLAVLGITYGEAAESGLVPHPHVPPAHINAAWGTLILERLGNSEAS